MIGNPLLRTAWAHAAVAALLASAAAAPLALAIWRGPARLRAGIGTVAAAVALAGLALTVVEPAGNGWRPVVARAALGLPVSGLAAAASLARAEFGALRAAGTFLSPAARLRRIILPLMAPGLAGGALIVFVAALTDGLGRGGPEWSLPVAAMTAWMIWMIARR